MPKYQKISQVGNVIKFKVVCDELGGGQPPHSEEQTYVLGAHPDFKDETEEELMSRVAHHINDGILESKKIRVVVFESAEEAPKEALPKEKKSKVEESK